MSIKIHKPHLLHKTWPMPEGYPIESITLRELDSKDELQAAQWAKIKGGSDPTLLLGEENMRIAIVAVNGQNVEQPYTGIDSWNANTRRLVAEAWSDLNSIDEDSLEVFRKAGRELQPPLAATVTAVNE